MRLAAPRSKVSLSPCGTVLWVPGPGLSSVEAQERVLSTGLACRVVDGVTRPLPAAASAPFWRIAVASRTAVRHYRYAGGVLRLEREEAVPAAQRAQRSVSVGLEALVRDEAFARDLARREAHVTVCGNQGFVMCVRAFLEERLVSVKGALMHGCRGFQPRATAPRPCALLMCGRLGWAEKGPGAFTMSCGSGEASHTCRACPQGKEEVDRRQALELLVVCMFGAREAAADPEGRAVPLPVVARSDVAAEGLEEGGRCLVVVGEGVYDLTPFLVSFLVVCISLDSSAGPQLQGVPSAARSTEARSPPVAGVSNAVCNAAIDHVQE